MTRQIILHIGSPKCGSTYLQRILLQNAPTLRDRGIHYPHDGGPHPGNAAGLEQIDAAGLAALFPGNTHTTVLSHEDLYALPRRGKPLASLAREAGITVQPVVFIRPFSEFIFGDYSQFMKQHFETFLAKRAPYDGRSFQEFALRRIETLKPAGFLSGWNKLFPDAPLILEGHRRIRPVIEQLLGADSIPNWELHEQHTNPSLRMEDCDRIAAAMRNPDCSKAEIRAMFRDAFHTAGQPDRGRTLEHITWLEAAFEPQNAALLRIFGYDNRRPPADILQATRKING